MKSFFPPLFSIALIGVAYACGKPDQPAHGTKAEVETQRAEATETRGHGEGIAPHSPVRRERVTAQARAKVVAASR